MADKIKLEVVTPERRVLSVAVADVILPSVEGYLGVLPGHAPLLAMLDAGELSYTEGGRRHYMAVSGGYAEVLRDAVTILARTSELADEIDVERAERARRAAEEQLDAKAPSAEFERAEVRLKRALSRIKVHNRRRA